MSEDQPSILIVDDDAAVRGLLQAILDGSGGYRTGMAASAAEARDRLAAQPYEAALIDHRMPGETGIELLKYIRAHHPDTASIMVTASDDFASVNLALDIGAYGYVVKPFRTTDLLINLGTALRRRALQMQTRAYIHELEDKVLGRTKRLQETLAPFGSSGLPAISAEEVVERLSGALSLRDEETGQHIRRMSSYSALLAAKVGLGVTHEEMRLASSMHDVGKIGVPDAILLKPGPLNPEERWAMQRHAYIGHELLADSTSPLLGLAAVIALRHHERWDGTGYPSGLAGEEIPGSGRVTAVADVFDALTSDRVYRPALPVATALDMLRQRRGSHFDPDYLDAFFDNIDEVLDLRASFN